MDIEPIFVDYSDLLESDTELSIDDIFSTLNQHISKISVARKKERCILPCSSKN